MADKVEKPKKSKAKPTKDEKGVLAALPSTRPDRIGTRRPTAPKTFERPEAATAAAASATPKPAAKKPGGARSKAQKRGATAATKKRATTAKPASTPRATAARRKAAAPRTFEPTQAAESAAGAADARAVGVTEPTPLRTPSPQADPRPRAVREGAPGISTSGAREQPSPEHGRPSGVELVTTAVQAAGELTQIGLTIGGKLVKRAVDRLPKP